ncbi:MAG TPA: hypothetical protein VE988_25565 [Gemmataceae bacterium]|nr:hypothetical protein [Gemmataceae bacterium]
MTRKRLEFFIGHTPVGYFRERGYPIVPGRYRYTPYRGVGHMRLVRGLRKGSTVECWFSRHRQKTPLMISREDVVEGQREYCWFVVVSELGPASGTS